MGRWRAFVSVSRIITPSKSVNNLKSYKNPPIRSRNWPLISEPRELSLIFRPFSALPALSPPHSEEFDFRAHGFDENQILEELLKNEEARKMSVKAFFVGTRFDYCSINLEFYSPLEEKS